MIKLLTFSTLYPNASEPRKGLFVEQRLVQLLGSGSAQAQVMAPVPWFPFSGPRFGRYAVFARVPHRESRRGVEITHPRYPLIPKFGMTLAPLLMAAALRSKVRKVLDSGFDFRAIDAHYFYPDGVAAVLLGRWLDRPVVVTARGTDVNLIPSYRLPRRQILWAARRCAAIITVCEALKERLLELGVPDGRVTVLRNGVDLEKFHPVDKAQARSRLGLEGEVLLSVGYLIERKGHHLAIEAIRHLPGTSLVIVGEGVWETRLKQQAHAVGVAQRVRFAGSVSQDQLRQYYSAATALVLASSREGMANVLLESLACGTPVVATRAWGTPEVIAEPEAGVLMRRRDPESLVHAYRELRAAYPEPWQTRRYAERFGWDDTTQGQLRIFSGLRERVHRPQDR